MAVTLSVYNMHLRNIGRAYCIVCSTNPKVGRTTALPAHYVPAPLENGLISIDRIVNCGASNDSV